MPVMKISTLATKLDKLGYIGNAGNAALLKKSKKFWKSLFIAVSNLLCKCRVSIHI